MNIHAKEETRVSADWLDTLAPSIYLALGFIAATLTHHLAR